MSAGPALRALVRRTLAAAAEEIFGLFERTIAEYEAERRDLLDGVFNRRLRTARADVQQLLVVEEAVPPERQECMSGLDQEDPEPPHIKEEPVELWTIQEGEQLQALEEASFNFPFTSVTVKIEDDVEQITQSSQFPESQTEASREAELLKTEADEDVCGGSGSASNLDPGSHFQTATRVETSSSESETDGETSSSSSESETDGETSSSSSESETDGETPSSESQTGVSRSDWMETGQPQSGSNYDLPVGDTGCVKGARRFGQGGHLQKRSLLGVHSGGKCFSCPVCKKKFSSNAHLVRHMRTHTGEKPFSCSVCGKKFALEHNMRRHLIVHTGEKPFSCSFCGKGFSVHSNLKQHVAIHTGETPFSCSFCGRGFSHHSNLKQHLTIHTGERPFSCLDCGRGFAQKEQLRQHMAVHTGEKPFSCSVCGRGFTQHGSMTRHMTVHTGEKPFSCSVCGRGFTQHCSLKRHLTTHRGDTI
ncbi:zinc finger protein 391-like [Cyclopterus lumpus]|uniref:zinc finger protein 391-like n=1 Tax=Cyclopterus lumpus TaxID=8103 RepID=UPI0014865936|nr:zinc finger protein 391-like [Cyclopterus lumpus]